MEVFVGPACHRSLCCTSDFVYDIICHLFQILHEIGWVYDSLYELHVNRIYRDPNSCLIRCAIPGSLLHVSRNLASAVEIYIFICGEKLDRMTKPEWTIGMKPNHILGINWKEAELLLAPELDQMTFRI
jgi:hypothetical protein